MGFPCVEPRLGVSTIATALHYSDQSSLRPVQSFETKVTSEPTSLQATIRFLHHHLVSSELHGYSYSVIICTVLFDLLFDFTQADIEPVLVAYLIRKAPSACARITAKDARGSIS